MIYAQPAELHCDEEGCSEKLEGRLVLNFGGGFAFCSSGLKDWQVCPNKPDPSGLMLSFCSVHKKQLTSLIQTGPAGLRLNPNAVKDLPKIQ